MHTSTKQSTATKQNLFLTFSIFEQKAIWQQVKLYFNILIFILNSKLLLSLNKF
jgi:hypothetical protein